MTSGKKGFAISEIDETDEVALAASQASGMNIHVIIEFTCRLPNPLRRLARNRLPALLIQYERRGGERYTCPLRYVFHLNDHAGLARIVRAVIAESLDKHTALWFTKCALVKRFTDFTPGNLTRQEAID
jgi:hypothetical protein